MSEFLPREDHEAEQFFRAELHALPLAHAVSERMVIVADNLSDIRNDMIADFEYEHDGIVAINNYVHHLDRSIQNTNEEAEKGHRYLYTRPLHQSVVNLQQMRRLLNRYARYAPSIFQRYSPVSNDSNWAENLLDNTVKHFGVREERLIMLAQTMQFEGTYTCKTYADLCQEGIRRGRIKN